MRQEVGKRKSPVKEFLDRAFSLPDFLPHNAPNFFRRRAL
jgi:hypothetical protein